MFAVASPAANILRYRAKSTPDTIKQLGAPSPPLSPSPADESEREREGVGGEGTAPYGKQSADFAVEPFSLLSCTVVAQVSPMATPDGGLLRQKGDPWQK